MTAAASHEQRMLVDGKLVESDTGKTFDNVNPATEEVLGRWPTAPAPTCTGPSTGPAGLRRDRLVHRPRAAQALPRPAAGRPRDRAGGVARGAHPRGGLPAHDHARQPARHPTGRRAALPDQAHRRVPLADRPARDRRPPGHGQHPPDLEGARRRRRRHRALELPARGDAEQTRPGPGHRQHRDPQAGARTRRGTPPGSAASSPSRPTSRPASSTSSPPPTTWSARS